MISPLTTAWRLEWALVTDQAISTKCDFGTAEVDFVARTSNPFKVKGEVPAVE